MLSARNLTKVIGKRTIVDSVSFDLQPGEVFGFLGPNGAGKTTTIRMLVGLIRPTSGSVTICGHDIRREFEKAMRCIGCIVENPDLYRFMTGRENLQHFARMLGAGASEIERVADLVSLAHRLDQRVGTYSLGMRQRLGIAQAMLGNPRVLILDEPANGLDPEGIRWLRVMLRGLADQGRTVLVSSHQLGEVQAIADRAVILDKGKLVRSGSLAELSEGTSTTVVRGPALAPLAAALAEAGVSTTTSDDGSLRARTADSALVGHLAFSHSVELHELRVDSFDLEQLFFALTSGETAA
jgi:ABC-2 type transport system ATP-binding protein